jgi:hypothetical protein
LVTSLTFDRYLHTISGASELYATSASSSLSSPSYGGYCS